MKSFVWRMFLILFLSMPVCSFGIPSKPIDDLSDLPSNEMALQRFYNRYPIVGKVSFAALFVALLYYFDPGLRDKTIEQIKKLRSYVDFQICKVQQRLQRMRLQK